MTLTAPPLIAQLLDDGESGAVAPLEPLLSRLVTDGADVVVAASPTANREHGFTLDPRVRFAPIDMGRRDMGRRDAGRRDAGRRDAGGSDAGRGGPGDGSPRARSRVAVAAVLPRAIREVRVALAGADLVHAHGRLAGLLAVAAGKRVPLVVSWYGEERGPLSRVVARWATVNCAGSWPALQRLRALGAADTRLVPPARPGEAVQRAREARAHVGAAGHPLVLVAAGGRDRARGLAIELGDRLEGRRQAPVVVAADDAPAAVGAADVLVSGSGRAARVRRGPRLSRGPRLFPGPAETAREALAAGVPVVMAHTSPDAVPRRSPVDPEADLEELAGPAALFAGGSAEQIAAAVGRVLDDVVLARRLAGASRRQAAGWPEEQETVAQLVAIYRELLPG